MRGILIILVLSDTRFFPSPLPRSLPLSRHPRGSEGPMAPRPTKTRSFVPSNRRARARTGSADRSAKINFLLSFRNRLWRGEGRGGRPPRDFGASCVTPPPPDGATQQQQQQQHRAVEMSAGRTRYHRQPSRATTALSQRSALRTAGHRSPPALPARVPAAPIRRCR